MKNKKNIILLVIIIVILVSMCLLFFNNKPHTKTNKDDLIDRIINRIDKKENFLIYVSENNCVSCGDMEDFILYYNKYYNVKFTNLNIDKVSENSYKKLLKKLGYKKVQISSPAVIYIKDGFSAGISNGIMTEDILKNSLINYGYMLKEEAESDNLISNEEFFKKFKDTKGHLIVFYTYDSDISYDFRGKVYKLSNKYKFNYDLVYAGMAYSYNITTTVYGKLRDKFTIPIMVLIGDNKVIDYVSENDTSMIEAFLKKHNYIK